MSVSGTMDRVAEAALGGADLVAGAVRLRYLLPASVERAWAGLTDPDHVVAWLGRLVGGPLRVGHDVEIWHDEDVRSRHTVVLCEPPHRLRMTWDFPGESTSVVLFTLTEAPGAGTRLDVLHEALEDPVSYAAGWHRHLEYLDAHLRGADRPFDDFWDGYDDLVERYRAGAARSTT